MAHIRKLVVLLSLAVAHLSASPVAAQTNDFDCIELLKQTRFMESNSRFRAVPNLVADTLSNIQGDDPANVRELLGDEQPILLTSIREYTGFPPQGGVLSCNLLIVDFFGSDGNRLGVEGANGLNWGRRLPVLTVGIYDTIAQAQDANENWRADKYNLPARFDRFSGIRKTEIATSAFLRFDLFPGQRWTRDTATFVSLSDLGPNFVEFFTRNEVRAQEMLVFCGTQDCVKINEALTVFEVQSQPVQSTGQTQEPDVEAPPPTPEIEITPIPPAEVVEEIEEPVTGPTVDTLQTYELSGAFTYVDNVGTEVISGLDQFDRLECLISAISDDVFVDAPQGCEGPAFNSLRDRGALMRVVPGENRLQIVSGARYPDALRVEVTLPSGVLGTSCQLDVAYMAQGGAMVSLPLEQIVGADPARFAVDLLTPPQRSGNTVDFNIIAISNPTECGGGDRIATVPSSEIVVVPLLENEPSLHAVSHILTLNENDLMQILELDAARGGQFGNAVLDAVHSAHNRLANTRADENWTLVNAAVASLQVDGTLDGFLELDSNDLRNRIDLEFGQVPQQVRNDLGRSSPPMTLGRLSDALRPLVEGANENGRIESLTLNIVAPVSGRSATGLVGPCTDSRYLGLQTQLSIDFALDLHINVYPVVRLKQDDAIEFADLLPVAVNAAAATQPSGLYVCRNAPPNMTIYPYFFEPWRSPVDFANRYASALSDQLALNLEKLALNSGGLQ